ncbi:MAG TPA: dipeptidase [Bryobacteraceae bacterium]|nr:dipeptidase [Bryobacteraceae bacterium]
MTRWLRILFLSAIPCFAQDAQARARKIQSEVIGIDTHIDTAQRILIEGVDITRRLPDGQVDIPRLREGGMRAPFFSLWVPVYYHGAEAVRRTLDLRDAMQAVFDAHPDQIELAVSAADVERITGARKIAAVLALEGGHQIDDDLRVLRMYYRLGIRAMTLTHFRNNHWADSSTDKPLHKGLTDFGRQVVREMNRIGMIVDISHVADSTFYQTLEVSSKPVIASHSSCRALTNMPRNMTDDMLRALAKNGGVVGINFYPGFINSTSAQASKKRISAQAAAQPAQNAKALDAFAAREHAADVEAAKKGRGATLADAIAHIDHAVKVAGVDHVGIGSDWDGIDKVPVGLEDVSKMTAVTAGLLERGYSEQDVRKIMGGNMLRVMRAAIGK